MVPDTAQEPTPEQMVAEDIDDLLSEDDALKQAAAQGIAFIDTFYVLEIGQTMPSMQDTAYSTSEQAEAALKEVSDPDAYTIVQTRTQAPPSTQN